TAAGTGTYTVAWQTVSADDGHFTKGAYSFFVGVEGVSSGAQFQVNHRSNTPEAAAVWLELAGHALLLGVLLLLVFVWRPLREPLDARLRIRTERTLFRILLGACGLIVIGAASYILLGSREVPLPNLITTVVGSFALYRLVLGVIIAGVLLCTARTIFASHNMTRTERVLLGLVGLLAILRARVSHAAASHLWPEFSVAVNAVHLVGKDIWIGGITAFVLAILPTLREDGRARIMALGLGLLSRMLTASLAVGGVTGAYIIWLHLKTPANLLATHWGLGLLSLTMFAFALLALRLYHQFRLDAGAVRIANGAGRENDREAMALAVYSLWTEAFVALAVLFVSSSLIITTPPLNTGKHFEQTAESQGVVLTFGEHPYDDDLFLLTATRDGKPAEIKNAVLTLSNDEEDIGPIVVPAELLFPGGYAFDRTLLSPAGHWRVGVTLQQATGYDATAEFTLRYPDDVLAVHADEEGRSLDGFAWTCIAAALILLLLSVMLRRVAETHIARAQRSAASAVSTKPETEVLWFVLLVDIVLIVLLGYHGTMHASGGFAEACAASGGMWHENVPMRDGKVTSPTAVLGCMIGMGQAASHFADAREFVQFTRPAHAIAQMTTEPQTLVPGKPATLTFTLKDLDGNPVTGLSREHDRILHTVVIGQDLQTFFHVHPEELGRITQDMLKTATFPVRATFPKAGKYVVAIDFTIRSKTVSQEFFVNVGDGGAMKPVAEDSAREKTFDGYDVRLDTPAVIHAKQPVKLHYSISKDGKPVTDLETYLAAPMHLAIVRSDLLQFQHTHGEMPQSWWDALVNPRDPMKHPHVILPDTFGPDIDAYTMFPFPGRYVVFGQFLHNGKVVTTRFEIEIH
ncbi:MAG TPA: hypothetical protein PKV72_05340, partial [Candidatus Peribacteria bacterium]|nr:hypothetical protein [Candidatus Peribacteria bacterium]